MYCIYSVELCNEEARYLATMGLTSIGGYKASMLTQHRNGFARRAIRMLHSQNKDASCYRTTL
jgi:hypothetical protein